MSRINLIAGPNNELLMTHEDDKRPFPIVIGTFAGSKEVVPIAQELMKMYNNQQEQLNSQGSTNVVEFKLPTATVTQRKEDPNNED